MEVELGKIRQSQEMQPETAVEANENQGNLITFNEEYTHYGWPLSNGFPPGYMIRIQGSAHRGGRRFEVNFALGPEYQKSNIALHSSVRFGEGGELVNNSFKVDKRWEEEERFTNVPITAGEKFEILILCEPTKFKGAINRHHFFDFEHRVPFTRVRYIDIRGDVTVNLLSFEDNTPQQIPSIDSGYPLHTIATSG